MILSGWTNFSGAESMPLKPLEVLRKGLNTLQKQYKAKKEQLQARLAKRLQISAEDEEWLDHEANFVDEQHVLETLEKASDYERGLERLDDAQKGVVRKLREVAGDIIKVPGKKRKRTCFLDSVNPTQ
jgi:CII-binding regulator of phage lambda lysogenization HflD